MTQSETLNNAWSQYQHDMAIVFGAILFCIIVGTIMVIVHNKKKKRKYGHTDWYKRLHD